jgi:hypothetical protein
MISPTLWLQHEIEPNAADKPVTACRSWETILLSKPEKFEEHAAEREETM